jgi:hypothetical protein
VDVKATNKEIAEDLEVEAAVIQDQDHIPAAGLSQEIEGGTRRVAGGIAEDIGTQEAGVEAEDTVATVADQVDQWVELLLNTKERAGLDPDQSLTQ